MIRRALWWLYTRLVDLPDDAIHLDPDAIDWIRANEPRYLAFLRSATQRNARRLRQVGWAGVGIAILIAAGAIWGPVGAGAENPVVPAWMARLHLFVAGGLLGLSWQATRLGRLLALIALLRGERVDRPAPGVPGDPGTPATSLRSSG